jgi:hypothetical protein
MVFMFLSLGWFFVYGPVFIAAFALAIVAIAQRRIVAGVCMLLITLVVPPVTFVSLFTIRSSTSATQFDASRAIPSAVDIVEWDVSIKDSRSTGSVHANWKFHLRNRSERPRVGQLWLYGYDKDGFECYQNVYEILTTIPPGGELKKIEEAFFEPGVYQKIDKFKIVWK